MTFAWSDELKTGNPVIDAQHKQLIASLNALLDACAKGTGREELLRTSRFLSDYTIRHFADEEALQVASGYPGYAAHKIIHDDFRATMTALAADLEREGPTTALLARMNRSLGNWLVMHIKGEDKKLADYLKVRQA